MKKQKNSFEKIKKRIKRLISKVWKILCKPEMAILPGQLAFFLILSLVPIITLIGYGASYFNISMDSIIDILKRNFDDGIINMIIPIISGKALDFKLVIMLIVMFYFASNGAASIIVTSNQIYGIKQTTWLKRRLKAIFLTFIIVILYLFILLVPVLGEKIINLVDYFEIKEVLLKIIAIIRGPFSWVVIYVFIKVIFTIAPDNNIPSSRINVGALFTTVGWILTTSFYSYYISHFAMYDLFYAGLSNIAVLMLWIYFLSYILVIGLSLTTNLENEELPKTGSIKN